MADLEAAVKTILHRRQLQQTVKRGKASPRSGHASTRPRPPRGKSLSPPKTRLKRPSRALIDRARELDGIERQAQAAKGELQSTCANETLLAELATLAEERRAMALLR